MTTPKSNPSKHYKHFRKTIAFCFRKLELCRHCRFRAGSFSGLSSRIQVLAHAMLTAMVILPRNCSIIKINSFEMHFRTAIGNLRVDRLLLVNIERSRDRCFNPLSIINDTITSYAPALLTCWGFCSSSYRYFFALSLS
jgi:hypothetical protein